MSLPDVIFYMLVAASIPLTVMNFLLARHVGGRHRRES